MRAREFINEGKMADIPAKGEDFPEEHMAANPGAVSMPDISDNKSSGSPYKGWRFGIAMAGAPDYPTPPAGPMAGDPLLTCYTDTDMEIIQTARDFIGAGRINKLNRQTSHEIKSVNKVSPIKGFKGYKK
jgi:hypothetical protein